MGRFLISIGISFVIVGLLWQLGLLKNLPFGRLPGDVTIERGNMRFYFPIVSSIIVSIILSAIFCFIRKIK
ncbi:MAG: DUF2905 domain-containing protein [Bdellovibrionota bacterium]